ncbi:hypothetical protein [Chroococcidiopsis sp. CCNUC1]|jgi:hypothetical protein|uniref:hypothetical protein n=1 Tax=Chroococcidiopsis sp. CCNUC1 TaxID=2653189 RepID=UPI00201FDA3E|nr:hypothetical protein [Chroococcidiopsis sp. CCNUC1]URD53524.1 hypothetical protein M5J74_29585 [Chroococcidiopsis sp. CCNUC1]
MLLNYLGRTVLLALIAIVLTVGCYQTTEEVGSIYHEDDLKLSKVALNLTAVTPYISY